MYNPDFEHNYTHIMRRKECTEILFYFLKELKVLSWSNMAAGWYVVMLVYKCPDHYKPYNSCKLFVLVVLLLQWLDLKKKISSLCQLYWHGKMV